MSDYIVALWQHWQALMGGGVSLMIAIFSRVAESLPRRITTRAYIQWLLKIPNWLFIGIGILCMFWAGFEAWSVEHKKNELDPVVHITLDGKYSPAERRQFDDWAVTLWVYTTHPIEQALLTVSDAYYEGQPMPLPGDVRVARFVIGNSAFSPTDIGNKERYTLLVSAPHNDHPLHLMTSPREEQQFRDLSPLKVGSWMFELQVNWKNAKTVYKACALVPWTGNMHTTTVKIREGACK